MKILTHFHHLRVSKDFDSRLKKWISVKLSPWVKTENLTIEAYVQTSVPRKDLRGAIYECHLTASAPWLPRKIVVRESGPDFWTMLYDCMHIARRQLRKLKSVQKSRRRRFRLNQNMISV